MVSPETEPDPNRKHSDDPKPTGKTGLRVQPKELEIPPEDPFKYDLLGRKEPVEALTSIVGSIEGPCVMAVDAGWGTGKTTFLRMWSHHLRNHNFSVVDFNAWETDFADDPLVALSAEIIDRLGTQLETADKRKLDTLKDATIKLLRGTAPSVLRVGLSLVPQAGAQINDEINRLTKARSEEALSDYEAAKKAILEFKCVLGKTASKLAESKGGKPLIIVIDELDRCRPSYAVELLEVAKHLFTVDGIVFVLAVDRSQLTHSIKVLYGNEFDSDGYLRRFFDADFRLPDPDKSAFVEATLLSVGFHSFFARIKDLYGALNSGNLMLGMMNDLLGKSDLSLRSIAQAIHRLGLVLASLPSNQTLHAETLTVLLIMRSVKFDIYRRFVGHEATDKETIVALKRNIRQLNIENPQWLGLVEAVVIGARLNRLTPLKEQGDGANSPLLREYIEMVGANSSKDMVDKKSKSHATTVLKYIDRYSQGLLVANGRIEIPGLGFDETVNRLELISTELSPIQTP